MRPACERTVADTSCISLAPWSDALVNDPRTSLRVWATRCDTSSRPEAMVVRFGVSVSITVCMRLASSSSCRVTSVTSSGRIVRRLVSVMSVLLNSQFDIGAVVRIGCGITDYGRGGMAEVAHDLAALIRRVQERCGGVVAARTRFPTLTAIAGAGRHHARAGHP